MDKVLILSLFIGVFLLDFWPRRQNRGKRDNVLYLILWGISLSALMSYPYLGDEVRISTLLEHIFPKI